MTRDMPIIEVRNKLTSLPEEFAKEPKLGAVAVTRRGKPVLALMSWELYESIVETLEILSDEELMKALRQSIKEVEQNKVLSWEEAKEKLA